MNKNIASAFENKKAFIGFVTAGDPDLDTSRQILLEMAKNGCDLIEVGIPFSDPIAEGPVIQEANIRALAQGVTTDKVFDLVAEVSAQIDIPLVFMTYLNVLFRYGYDRFCRRAADSGISGVIVPDLPYEEKHELSDVAKKYGIAVISLVAPTSHERVMMIAKEAEGFLYQVSSLGVPGLRAGQMVLMKVQGLGDINLDQYVLLEKVTHTWANDDHTMEFETLGLEHV